MNIILDQIQSQVSIQNNNNQKDESKKGVENKVLIQSTYKIDPVCLLTILSITWKKNLPMLADRLTLSKDKTAFFSLI